MSDEPRSSVARRVYLPFALVAVVVVACDQLSKWWAVDRLSNGRSVHIIGSFEFRLASNTGMAFSLGTARGAIIGVVAVVIVVVLAVSARKVRSRGAVLLMGLISGGALGNLSDRLFRGSGHGFMGGGVIDFIALHWWPTFNIADSSVVVGGLLLAIWVYRDGASDPETEAEPRPLAVDDVDAAAGADVVE